MDKLKRSITELGFASAVISRRLPSGEIEILGGHHRVLAAKELGLTEIPVLILENVDETQARKINQVDNARYGTDDSIALAKLLDEIGLSDEDLASFLPFEATDFADIKSSIDIDVSEIGIVDQDDEPGADIEDYTPEQRTHDVMRFRVSIPDAEKIRKKLAGVMKSQGFNDRDEMTAAGDALVYLLIGGGA